MVLTRKSTIHTLSFLGSGPYIVFTFCESAYRISEQQTLEQVQRGHIEVFVLVIFHQWNVVVDVSFSCSFHRLFIVLLPLRQVYRRVVFGRSFVCGIE